jgi:hypothetical protein
MSKSEISKVTLIAGIAVLGLGIFVGPAQSASVTGATITVTGTVSCAHCQGIQPVHKGYTPFSWALYSVSQGDDIVLVMKDKAYKLAGDKKQILRYMSEKARVTGRVDGSMLTVETIGRAAKNE